MKVKIKIFSILRHYVPDYDPQEGLEIELADEVTVAEMLNKLGIPGSQVPVVTCSGRVLHRNDKIKKDSTIDIFQSVAGG